MAPADTHITDTKRVLRGMLDDMRAIGAASSRLGEVVTAINETAFSTSLFALARNVEAHEISTNWTKPSEVVLEECGELVAVSTRGF
jgi:hypothetical protein